MISHICRIERQQTSEYNMKAADSWIQRINQWLPIGEHAVWGRGEGGTNY